MKNVYLKGKVLPDGSVTFKRHKKMKQNVRYIIKYHRNGIYIEHTYHPFWDIEPAKPNVESFRLTIIDFSNAA